jgi:hypothetical protein
VSNWACADGAIVWIASGRRRHQTVGSAVWALAAMKALETKNTHSPQSRTTASSSPTCPAGTCTSRCSSPDRAATRLESASRERRYLACVAGAVWPTLSSPDIIRPREKNALIIEQPRVSSRSVRLTSLHTSTRMIFRSTVNADTANPTESPTPYRHPVMSHLIDLEENRNHRWNKHVQVVPTQL